jgi:hypothetical protein
LLLLRKGVDARHKAGHDEGEKMHELNDFLFQSGPGRNENSDRRRPCFDATCRKDENWSEA